MSTGTAARLALARIRAQMVAVDAGHQDVKHHQVGPHGDGLGEGVQAVPGSDNLKAFQTEVEFDQATDVGVIVGHKHGSGQLAALSCRWLARYNQRSHTRDLPIPTASIPGILSSELALDDGAVAAAPSTGPGPGRRPWPSARC